MLGKLIRETNPYSRAGYVRFWVENDTEVVTLAASAFRAVTSERDELCVKNKRLQSLLDRHHLRGLGCWLCAGE